MAIIMTLYSLVLGLGLYQEHANRQQNKDPENAPTQPY